MIIVGISDLHSDVSKLAAISEDLCKADVVVISGDVTNFGDGLEMANMLREVGIYNKNILAVPGNCDSPQACQYLAGQEMDLDRKCKVVNGVAFVGIGGALPGPSKTPNEISEFEFKKHLEAALGCVDKLPIVLVTHQPPYNTKVDKVGASRHVGSDSIRQFIIEDQPVLCFCGHIHESVGQDTLNNTIILNPGPLRLGGYAYVEFDGKVQKAEIRRA